jgi:dihydroxy-acid dehydratase
MAGRVGIKIDLPQFDEIAQRTPVIANIRPSGQFLMEDFYYAGGVPAVIRELGDLINRDALTVNGKTIGENTATRKRLSSRLRERSAC